MKNILLVFCAAVLFAQCKKNTVCDTVTTTAPASEVANLKTAITSLGVPYSEDSRGFFYQIINAGAADKPSVCNTVNVNYNGELFNGSSFDSGSGVSFPLGNLIEGWKEGIPLIGKGGKIILYLPPTLAYGSSGSGSIPPNANLIFTIDLIDFK